MRRAFGTVTPHGSGGGAPSSLGIRLWELVPIDSNAFGMVLGGGPIGWLKAFNAVVRGAAGAGGLGGDAAVHLDREVGHLLEATNLVCHLGYETLSPEARIDGHDEDVVEVRQRPLDELRRRRRVQGDARLAAAVPDHGQRPVEVGHGLGLDGDARHPRLDKRWDQVVRAVHHQVGVYG